MSSNKPGTPPPVTPFYATTSQNAQTTTPPLPQRSAERAATPQPAFISDAVEQPRQEGVAPQLQNPFLPAFMPPSGPVLQSHSAPFGPLGPIAEIPPFRGFNPSLPQEYFFKGHRDDLLDRSESPTLGRQTTPPPLTRSPDRTHRRPVHDEDASLRPQRRSSRSSLQSATKSPLKGPRADLDGQLQASGVNVKSVQALSDKFKVTTKHAGKAVGVMGGLGTLLTTATVATAVASGVSAIGILGAPQVAVPLTAGLFVASFLIALGLRSIARARVNKQDGVQDQLNILRTARAQLMAHPNRSMDDNLLIDKIDAVLRRAHGWSAFGHDAAGAAKDTVSGLLTPFRWIYSVVRPRSRKEKPLLPK